MTTSSCLTKPPEVDAELGTTWKAVLQHLSDEVSSENFVTWLRPTVLLHLDDDLAVIEHLAAPPSVVVDTDLVTGEAVEGLYGLLRSVKALDREVPAGRRRWPLAAEPDPVS